MENEITSYDYEDISKLAKLLLKNNYVCMLSVEDSREDGTCLYVLDYIWCEDEANRNQIIFKSAD